MLQCAAAALAHAPRAARGVSASAATAAAAAALVVAEGGASTATRTAVAAAGAGGLGVEKVDVLVMGADAGDDAAATARLPGVGAVLALSHASLKAPTQAEPAAAALAAVAAAGGYSHVVCASTSWAKGVLPRAAALAGVQPVTDVLRFEDDGESFVRPIYAGNALETVRYKASGDGGPAEGAPRYVSVRTTAFEPVSADGGAAAVDDVVAPAELDAVAAEELSSFVSAEVSESERPELGAAPIVVSGGRGLKNGDNFKLMEDLADALGGGAIGASRAAVDAGFCANDMQVGQTGKVVAPDLYVAVGISGAIQHVAGMKDSKVIVAINKDEDAPIFSVADYGLKADLFEAVPELIAKVKAARA